MKISVIIPTRNRHQELARTLESLAELNFGGSEFEILVIDNASTDQTSEVARAAAGRFEQGRLRYALESMPGLLSGRHCGAQMASGEICAFLDDDVRVGMGWPAAIKEAFHDPAVALVGGPSTPLFESEPPEWLDAFYTVDERGRHCAWLSLFDGGPRIIELDSCYVWGLNFAIRRKALFDLGGFHPDSFPKCLQRYQGDGETGLSVKIKKSGLKSIYHPGAGVKHEVATSRLKIEYFEERSFFQGVCDSYTEIRERTETKVVEKPWHWKDSLRRAKRSFQARLLGDRRLFRDILLRSEMAYQSGYQFHQAEVARDPVLLQWVLRKDYWDYQLPTGWENYLTKPAPPVRGERPN